LKRLGGEKKRGTVSLGDTKREKSYRVGAHQEGQCKNKKKKKKGTDCGGGHPKREVWGGGDPGKKKKRKMVTMKHVTKRNLRKKNSQDGPSVQKKGKK